jgi:serine/threonine protein kinase
VALNPGARIGPYEVAAQIGEGGMGVVYRATDTNLGRAVALKVLPDSVAHDPERVARLEREAKTLAALNHPNIAHIYGFERSNPSTGSGQAGVHALVMELVDGPTLADRIAQGAVPLDEALAIARQIAEALEAAHEQGIIHRDLKPANVKVRDDGIVKVLDFGLAKAMEPTGAGRGDVTNSPTLSIAATQAGLILGTAAYMSPEQASGRPVDRRSDLWAFGVVLLEMLTGRRVFEGETISHVLAAVLTKEPDWSTLPLTTPTSIRRLLRRCLEKDRRRRLPDAAVARLEIEDALSAPASEVAPVVSPVPSSRGSRLGRIAAASALLLLVGLAVPAVRYLREAPSTPPLETRVDIVTPATRDLLSFALSPDGRSIVFAASGDGTPRLWLRSLASTIAQPLPGTDGATFPFWSPDSRSVGFFADGQLKRLDLGAGAPRPLATAVARGGTWSTEGVILFAPTFAGPLSRVTASGGTAVPVTELRDGQNSHRFPVFLPDGRHFLFYAQGRNDTAGIDLGSLDAADTTTLLTAADSAGAYLAPGWLFWVRAETLMAQRLDLARREMTGDPVAFADVVSSVSTNAPPVSASASGLVAYRSEGASRRQLTWFDRTGKVLGILGAPDDSGLIGPNVSPDGQRAVAHRVVQGNVDIWLLDGPRMSRLTFDAGGDRFGIWSPNGSRIAFDSSRTGPRNLYEKPATGAGMETLLLESAQTKGALDWSRDGRFLLYFSIDPQTDADLWVLPLEGDRKPWAFLKTQFNEFAGRFSPDGRWIAYMSNESGRMEIYIRPFAPRRRLVRRPPGPRGSGRSRRRAALIRRGGRTAGSCTTSV